MFGDELPPESRTKRKRQRGWGEKRGDFLDGTPSAFDPSASPKKTKVISAFDFNQSQPAKTYSRERAGPVGAQALPIAAFSTEPSERAPFRPRRRSAGRFGGRSAGENGGSTENRNLADELSESTSPKRKARDKVMDILARRPHSKLEIEQKLAAFYEPQEIAAAIQFAEDNHWMMAPDEMAHRLSLELGRRKKGHRYIAQYLKKKGLPAVETDRELEIEKALELIASKAERFARSSERATDRATDRATASSSAKNAYEAKRAVYTARQKNLQKLQAALASRGFDGDTISRALRIWQEQQS